MKKCPKHDLNLEAIRITLNTFLILTGIPVYLQEQTMLEWCNIQQCVLTNLTND